MLDTLRKVSKLNPALLASGAAVHASEKNLENVRAGNLPKVNLTSQAGLDPSYQNSSTGPGPLGVSLQISQPIFDGFRTRNLIGQANSQIAGANEDFRGTQQTTLLKAASAFIVVSSNRAVLELSNRYEKAITEQLKTVNSMHSLGDVSGSDVAEVKMRLASAQAQTSQARAALESSIAEYVRVVGEFPSDLATAPAIDRMLPSSLQAAIDTGLRHHPSIFAATRRIEESQYLVGVAKSDTLPSLSVQGTVGWDQVAGSESTNSTLVAKLSIPLFDGGGSSARLQKAKIESTQRQFESKASKDAVVAAVATSWNLLADARYRNRIIDSQVSAAKTALNGIRESYKMGERSTYDVLNAEQDVSISLINEVLTLRDFKIATYALAQAMGILDMSTLEHTLNQMPQIQSLQPQFKAAEVENGPVIRRVHKFKLTRANASTTHKLVAFRKSIVDTPLKFQPSHLESNLQLRSQSFE